jgi:uncharacterized membrane protein
MLEEGFVEIIRILVRVVEAVGVAIIVIGAFATLIVFLKRFLANRNRREAVADFRSDLGRAILLGLEFLVAADIINTVAIEPTLRNVGVLAGIVAIRTVLSISLGLEIEGRWPWQRHQDQERKV